MHATPTQAAFTREAKGLEQVKAELERERGTRQTEGEAMAALEKEAAALRLEEKRLKVRGDTYMCSGIYSSGPAI